MWFAPGKPAPDLPGDTLPFVLPGAVSSSLSALDFCYHHFFFYSHVSCSLDSERYLLQTPLAFFPLLFKLYSHVLLFFCKACLPVLGIPRARWISFLHLPGCGLSWVYCICLSWSSPVYPWQRVVHCKAPLKTLPLPPTAL